MSTSIACETNFLAIRITRTNHIRDYMNYDSFDLFYHLLRGENKLKRIISLLLCPVINELLEANLYLDSRVESTMDNEEMFLPPYNAAEFKAPLALGAEQAFREDAAPTRFSTTASMKWPTGGATLQGTYAVSPRQRDEQRGKA
ncbi:hypothetical protein [Natrononativus amylolyticus]|uniref:hypothetical protein n=1 Tax=Natrononativus amylolyticus TaxID=2963434 RepID=UPI0020CE9445|nr:hypothetical protein [Natrononativus amylolyticus]